MRLLTGAPLQATVAVMSGAPAEIIARLGGLNPSSALTIAAVLFLLVAMACWALKT